MLVCLVYVPSCFTLQAVVQDFVSLVPKFSTIFVVDAINSTLIFN
jgi:hypothetical protein